MILQALDILQEFRKERSLEWDNCQPGQPDFGAPGLDDHQKKLVVVELRQDFASGKILELWSPALGGGFLVDSWQGLLLEARSSTCYYYYYY